MTEPPASEPGASPHLSPNRSHFWDGSAWQAIADNGHSSWNGSEWVSLPWWALPDLEVDWLIHGSYLGGHPRYPKPVKPALLQLRAADGVHVNGKKPSLILSHWGAVQDIVVEGSDVFQRRASSGALLAFGLLGYAASTGKYSYVTVTAPDGPVAFEAKGVMARELNARLYSVLQHYPQGAPATTSVGPPADDPYEQLTKLGKLRDAGIVTAEEFEAKKTELLRRI